MAAVGYLFLLTISFASGSYFKVGQDGSHSAVLRSFYHPRRYIPYRKLDISPWPFLEECISSHHSELIECLKELESILGRFKEDTDPKFNNKDSIPNTRNSIQGNLNENNKQIDKSENYINSILDEDKRDASSINALDNVQNSSWIEIKDPRKTAPSLKSEIADAKDTGEFVSFEKEKIIETEGKGDASIVEEMENKRNSSATYKSNIETTTEIQQTTMITETGDIAISGKIHERTTVTEETSNVTHILEVTEGNKIADKNPISTAKIDEGNEENINVQKNTTSDSLSENTEKSTTADLHTDSVEFRLKVTTDNPTVNETDIEVTTENETANRSSSTEQNISTESRSILTSVATEGLNNDTTLANDETTTSTVLVTTLTTKSESVSVSDADTSETESATSSSTVIYSSVSVTESPGYTTESTADGGFASTMITDLKSSNGDYVTKSIPVVPEHVINIRSIKIAKIVLSVLLLVTGLIAVVMLAVYMFKVRRGAVQYDQLTLLP